MNLYAQNWQRYQELNRLGKTHDPRLDVLLNLSFLETFCHILNRVMAAILQEQYTFQLVVTQVMIGNVISGCYFQCDWAFSQFLARAIEGT